MSLYKPKDDGGDNNKVHVEQENVFLLQQTGLWFDYTQNPGLVAGLHASSTSLLLVFL